jgi:hypothetical protein
MLEEYYQNLNDSCYLKEDIPQGYGMIHGSHIIAQCSLDNCISCIDNYRHCTRCKSDEHTVYHEGRIITCSGYLSDSNNAPVKYFKPLNSCKYRICIKCDTATNMCIECIFNTINYRGVCIQENDWRTDPRSPKGLTLEHNTKLSAHQSTMQYFFLPHMLI